MPKIENRIVKNRKSPNNEQSFINAYKQMNKEACKQDGLDIAAVRAKDGTPGHALLKPEINRGKDGGYHRGEDFIADSELKKMMRNK